MPYQPSSPESLERRARRRSALGIETTMVDITPQIDAYFARFPDADALRRGNKMARERMTILYDHSAELGGARPRHQQQDRAAARLRHAPRRHGLGR